MTSPITLVTGGHYCPPSPPSSVSVIVQEQIAGSIAANPSLVGFIVEDCDAPAFAINSFGLVAPAVVEIGAVVSTPSFTAAYNRPPTSAVLTNDDNAEAKNVIATPNSFSSDQNYVETTPNQSTQWILTADDGGAPDIGVVMAQWRARHWMGFHASPGPLTDAQVLAMTQLQTALSTNTTFDVTFAAVAGLYFHHVWHDFFLPLDPTKYFTDGLFNSGVVDVGPVTISSTPSAFTARNVRTGLLNTSGSPIRFERRA